MIRPRRLAMPFTDADRDQAATFVAAMSDRAAHPIAEHIAEHFTDDEMWEFATILLTLTPPAPVLEPAGN